MHFSKAFLPFALKAAPICPAPAPADGVEESNSIDDVKCSSTLEVRLGYLPSSEDESGTKSFRVNTPTQASQPARLV